MKLITNVNIVNPHRIIKNGAVLIDGKTIIDILEDSSDADLTNSIEIIDGRGLYASSGFIDIHVHGGAMFSALSAAPDEIIKMCNAHSKHGTTSILPTTSAAPINRLFSAIDNIKEAQKKCKCSNILGVHLEGPYFAPSQKGAQNADFLKPPVFEEYKDLIDYWDGIKIMGAAPELEGALELGRELTKRGIIPSIAHSDASYNECIMAYENGYKDVTHIYSGCSSVVRKNAFRTAGVVEAGMMLDELFVQVIGDGKHLPASLLKYIYKNKGADRICLISDGLSSSACDIKEGTSFVNNTGIEVIVEDGVMKLMDRTAFAGSLASSDRLVRNMIKLADVPMIEAIKMATLTPARFLGLKTKGMLSIGYDADIVLFDDDINVKLTMVLGNVIHNKL